MRKFLVAVPLILLAGCATWGQMKTGLDGLVNRPVSAAIERIGYPNSEQTIAGRKLYRWGRNTQSAVFMPSTTTTTGSIGTGSAYQPFSSSTAGGTYMPVSLNCEIILEVDANDIIQRYQYNGNLSGCRPFITALNKK